MERVTELESETVETLEGAALQLTSADSALIPKSNNPGQQKWSAGNPKLKMEPFLYCLVLKSSPN
jgi:hypothetical protein